MKKMKKWRSSWEASEAVVGMLMVQLFTTGLQLLSRVILSQGSFVFALLTYRHLVAALCVAPFAFLLEKDNSKKLSLVAFFWLFLNALTGISLAMGLFYYGLRDTSATYATNFLNLIPIVTFAFAVISRIEKLGLGMKAGKVKTGGAVLCVIGALIIILYKGKTFHICHQLIHTKHIAVVTSKTHMTRGTIMLLCSCLSYATWFIVQVKLLKVFASKYWATMLTCIIAALQSMVVGLCLDRSKAAWKLGWDLQLVTIVYSGALATAASFCLISRVVANRGPTFPAMFNPLALIFVTIFEALLLGEPITVGSLVGMVTIILGLYSFLWGRKRELTMKSSWLPPNVSTGEGATAVPDSATATVNPAPPPSSSSSSAIDIEASS
ncbi:WAT1-related protein At1g43650-like [Malania oleifera]|uniref:WAT1-related protein At1g43650-like n=1 Tax=Malania oleifera TaxID=397392 RepID=UPI0025AE1DC2|nr:WAT1-related protein At1g43650-like [Malania oleifera]